MAKKKRKILLCCPLAPGDVLMLTSAVRDLKIQHGNKFDIAVSTTAMPIWDNNPHLTQMDFEHTGYDENGKPIVETDDKNLEVYRCNYNLVEKSNTAPYHFIHGYAMDLEEKLKIKIELTKFSGDIHLSDEEKSWMSSIEEQGCKDKFWIIIAGGKYDFTAKWWSPQRYQQVVDYFKDKITFVQCGESHGPPLDENGNKTNNHFHPPLKNVIDIRNKTNIRQFIRLMYHASGVVCPVTMAMHLAAAVEMKHTPPKNRPCVVIAGGREPSQWEAYPHHQYIHKNGSLPCCDDGGCWRSRCQLIGDGDEKDENPCDNYTQITPNFRIPRCMDIITAGEVIRRIESYYDGGSLQYNGR